VPSSTPTDDEPREDSEERKGRAAALREQIEELRRGAPRPPSNPREFVERSTTAPDDPADEDDQ
jgi:hypothetical protein